MRNSTKQPIALAAADLVQAGVVCRGSALAAVASGWSLDAMAGELVDLLGSGGLTIAALLIHEAQCRKLPAIWLSLRQEQAYGPDLAALGIDVGALPLLLAGDPLQVAGMAEMALHGGAFRLLIADLAGCPHNWPTTVQQRLARLASHHQATLIRIGRNSQPGRFAGITVHCLLERADATQARCRLSIHRRHHTLQRIEVCHVPDGLCLDS